MEVFSEEWKQQVANRYKHLQERNKPFVCFLAIDDKFQPLREEIEECVSELPTDIRKRVLSNLQSPKNFSHTYHELIVGKLLRRHGYIRPPSRNLSWKLNQGSG